MRAFKLAAALVAPIVAALAGPRPLTAEELRHRERLEEIAAQGARERAMRAASYDRLMGFRPPVWFLPRGDFLRPRRHW